LTFTRKAAGELQHRLRQLGLREEVAAGTFHALASAQLHRWWADRHQQPPALLERKARLLGPLVGSRAGLTHVPLADLAGQLEWAKARMITPDRFEQAVRAERRVLPGSASAASVAALYARYEFEKQRRGLVDFDDLLSQCADAIERDPEFAGAQRWRWRHVFVDEFQDLNPLQHRLLLAWLGSSVDLCVVGDPHQAIYGWNGSDPDLLAQLPRRWPSAEVVRLDANHRCTPQIVAAASAVLGADGSGLSSAAADGPVPSLRAYPSETWEAHGITSELKRAHAEGRRWGSMAVLSRTNAQLVIVQNALAAAGVPHWAPSQAGLLDNPAVREEVARLRHISDRPIQAVIADLADAAEEVAASQLTPGLADDEGRAALTVLADLARAFAGQEPAGTAGRWLAWLPTALRDGSESGPASTDVVTLCSFHRAKGLEWDAVWIVGLEQGLVPIGRAVTPAAEAEERRLLYVALTRAAVELHCSWARQRTFGTRSIPRDPSPWLQLIGSASQPAHSGFDSGMSPEGWRSRLADQRRSLHELSRAQRRPVRRLPPGFPDADPDLVSSLRSWRLETARVSGVPAYVVLHDTTLEALASLRPSTAEELLAVPGMGPVKADRYGPTLLSMLAERKASA
jgi:DNA helicase-2/ATP-dependent DNA helicase PcrA